MKLNFLKSSAWSVLSVMSRAVSSLVVNKLFALYSGPNGITLLSHFQNLLTILTNVPNGGINVGLVKHLAPEKPNSLAYRNYFSAALWLNVLATLAGLLVLFFSRHYYFGVFTAQLEHGPAAWWYMGFVAGVLLLMANLFLLNVLLSHQRLPAYVLLTVSWSMLSMGLGWWALQVGSLPLALLAVLAGQAVIALPAFFLAWRAGLLPRLHWQDIPKHCYRDLGKFILMALSTVLFVKLVDFFVRDYVITRFSLFETGLWQSVVKISDNYTLFFTSIMGMVYYPRLASLLPEPPALRKWVRQFYFGLLPLLAAGLGVFYLFSDFFILLLYSPEFLKARFLLDYQLIGDFFKLSSYVIAYLISVRADVRLYMGLQLGSGLLYVALLWWLIPAYGLEGITMAHAGRFIAYTVFHLWWFRKIVL